MRQMLFILLVVVNLLIGNFALAEERVIEVNAFAEKFVEPNIVNVNFEIWAKSSNAKAAQQMAASQVKSVRKILEDFKIKKEDIESSSYSLSPEYSFDPKEQKNKLEGFSVLHIIQLSLHKTEDLGAILDAVVKDEKASNSGVNINSILWGSEDRQKFESLALAEAVRLARVKADEIAKAAGVKIKNVLRISHGISGARPPMPVFRNYGMRSMSEMTPTELFSGSVKIKVDVTVEYEINSVFEK